MTALVEFSAGGACYAVPVQAVREVRPADALAQLPDGRPGVVGMLHLKDATVPVVDSLGAGRDHVLVLRPSRPGAFGLLVERVTAVRPVDDAEIAPPPAGQRAGLVTGVVGRGGDRLLLLDVDVLAEQVT